jgi:hypothetical protein
VYASDVKRLHRQDLFCWSAYQSHLRIDFHGTLWQSPEGCVLIDPMPVTGDDEKHLAELGGARVVILTNSMHVRGAVDLGVDMWGPAAEQDSFPVACKRWLRDGDSPIPGMMVRELAGSKTAGELALVLDETTVIFGDLVRAHRANTLMLLRPEQKLRDEKAARESLRRLRDLHPRIEHVLVGDGWRAFGNGGVLLDALLST